MRLGQQESVTEQKAPIIAACLQGLGEAWERRYSSALPTEACSLSVEDLSSLHCSSTDLHPETIRVFLAALWRNSFSLMAF